MSAHTNHTPGPWVVEHPYGESGVYVGGSDTSLVAKLYENHADKSACNAEANARLIAAAPKLLENLKMMTDLAEAYGVGEHCDGNIIEAREWIAKAEGEETARPCPGYAGPAPAGVDYSDWLAINNID